jgi:hypothetical protein
MPVDPALIAAIRNVVGHLAVPGLTTAAEANDVFEAYVLSRVLAAATTAGATSIHWRDRLDNSATTLIFRTAPGAIYSDRRLYTHALLTFPQTDPLEVHIGVIVEGKSGVAHECDVVVLPHSEGRLCRASAVNPRHSQIVIAVECKYYTGQIPLNLARSFVGLLSEISCTYGQCYFVVNTGSWTAEKMLAKQKRHWESDLLPNTASEQSITASFAKALRDYQVRNRNV